MTLEQTCEKLNIDYKKLLILMKDFMEEDGNTLKVAFKGGLEYDNGEMYEGTISLTVDLDESIITFKRHYTYYYSHSCNEILTTERQIITKGDMREIFGKFQEIYSDWDAEIITGICKDTEEVSNYLQSIYHLLKGD